MRECECFSMAHRGWTLIVRVFIVVRNKKNHVQQIYFMVEKFEIQASPGHQCACLTTFVPNIDLHLSVREQQPQTSNTISNVKYNPLRSIL